MGYVREDKYIEAALEIWRVLRPDGIWGLQDDCTDSGYIWRKQGQTNTCGQGEMLSEPTKGKLFAMLRAVGFEIHESGPGETLSPHKDVLEFDSRPRRHRLGHKFYAEAVKRVVPGFDISRPRWHDFRAQKRGRYLLPDLTIMHANETNREGN